MNLHKNILNTIDFCQLDITGKCNLNCSFCRQKNEKDLVDDMTMEEWLRVAIQLKEMNCTRISLAGGEPLMSKNLFNILDIINERIDKPAILTNGTLLTKNLIKKIAGKVKNLQVSVDSLNTDLHDSIRGKKGAWNETYRGIQNAIEAGIPVGVRITVFEKNADQALPLLEWAKKIGATSFLARRVVCSGNGIETKKIPPLELKKLFTNLIVKGLEIKMPVGFGDPFPHLLLSPKRLLEANNDYDILNGKIIGGCSVSIDAMYIAQNGSVLLCPYLPIYCGNVKKQSIKTIWRNSKAYKIARSIRNNLQGKCGACPYKFACGGCRANAYYETGSICGEDTGCWNEL